MRNKAPYSRPIFSILRPIYSRLRRASWRRGLATAALVGYVGSLSLSLLPTAKLAVDSVAFPCQHHQCGCVVAASCWDACCCFTPSEKLAWAAREKIRLQPAVYRQLVALRTQGAGDHAKSESAATCCSDSDPTAVAGCDRDEQANSQRSEPQVAAFRAPTCGGPGENTALVIIGAAAPLGNAAWCLQFERTDATTPIADVLISLFDRPPIPPPRV